MSYRKAPFQVTFWARLQWLQWLQRQLKGVRFNSRGFSEWLLWRGSHLEVDDDEEDEDGGEQVGDVRQVGPVERLLQCADFVGARDEQVEQRDHSALDVAAQVELNASFKGGSSYFGFK